MAETFTVTPAQLDKLRPGDIVTHFDGVDVGPITVTSHLARLDNNGPIVLPGRYPSSTLPVHIYPDTMIAETITVTRPAGPRPAGRQTRNIDGITLVSAGGQTWRTEDGRYEITYSFGGYTECEEDHPVRITANLADAARQAQGTSWARPILAAIAAGKRGYRCPAGSEHPYDMWQVWDLKADDFAADLRACESFLDAATSLARYLNR